MTAKLKPCCVLANTQVEILTEQGFDYHTNVPMLIALAHLSYCAANSQTEKGGEKK